MNEVKGLTVKSELERIRSGNINKDNVVTDTIETCKAKNGGYIPILIVEGEKGYHKTDWNWGKDKEIIRQISLERNSHLAHETIEAIKIYSMFG